MAPLPMSFGGVEAVQPAGEVYAVDGSSREGGRGGGREERQDERRPPLGAVLGGDGTKETIGGAHQDEPLPRRERRADGRRCLREDLPPLPIRPLVELRS